MRVLDIPLSTASHEDVLHGVARRIEARVPGGHISITNMESMYHARRQSWLRHFIDTAQYSLCDGVGAVLAAWFWGQRVRRFTGPIFQLRCTERGIEQGWRHFYYGGKAGVAEEM